MARHLNNIISNLIISTHVAQRFNGGVYMSPAFALFHVGPHRLTQTEFVVGQELLLRAKFSLWNRSQVCGVLPRVI